jgi:Fe-S cluster assembly protein SufD
MQAVAISNPYAESLSVLLSRGGEPASLSALRRRAMERFEALGFPTPRLEEWRSTNVAPIANAALPAATDLATTASVTAERIAPFTYKGTSCLVFVDGFFAPELSRLSELPGGAVACGLRQALENRPEAVLAHLGRHAGFEQHAFAALNTALHQDGAFLHIPRGVVVEEPIHLLFVSATPEVASYPRLLLVAEENSQATVVESYVSLHAGRYFTGPVSEVILGPNAVVDHIKIQRESLEAFHMAVQQTVQDRTSTLRSHSISIGGALVRNDVWGLLDGEGISCTLNGLYFVDGKQHVDNHMRVDHAKPNCYSHELYKGILDGAGRAVFNGLIYVHPDAQKTDAVQSNRNLLLSKNALASSNPQLEIFADDVRCTHGSTIGQLDEEAIFYLRSRGIGEAAAKSLLTYAFASDIVERIHVESVRRDMEEFLFARLPRGEVVRQAV